MALLSQSSLNRARELILSQGRLLERQLYRYFFEGGDRADCLRALVAYQNADGGFGNGLEPDLLCPSSSAIGAETALFVMEMLGDRKPDIVLPLLDWLEANQTELGTIVHPPADLAHYPHQPWWDKGDEDRVLVIAGLLSEWQDRRSNFFSKVRRFYDQNTLPESLGFYDYPTFAYLARCRKNGADTVIFNGLLHQLPSVLAENSEHFPLFSRYWYYGQDYVDSSVLEQAAASVAEAIEQDGGIVNLYPDLPWWRPMFTLDSLMLLKWRGFI